MELLLEEELALLAHRQLALPLPHLRAQPGDRLAVLLRRGRRLLELSALARRPVRLEQPASLLRARIECVVEDADALILQVVDGPILPFFILVLSCLFFMLSSLCCTFDF